MNGLLNTTSAQTLLARFSARRSTRVAEAFRNLPPRPNFDLETLESRLLLSVSPLNMTLTAASLDASDSHSTIVWANRGDNGGTDSDAFQATYGAALAPTARA